MTRLAPERMAAASSAVALRTGKRLLYEAKSGTVTNVPEANKYLSREYRQGWDPHTI